MAETVRAFVAIELPDEVKDLLWQLQEKLQSYSAARVARWVDPWGTHITLKFLGDVAIPRLPALVEALDEIAQQHAPFTLRLAQLGAFPNVHRPSVLWVGVEEGGEQIVALTAAVEAAFQRLGFKPERHDAFPHVTLARVKKEAIPQQRRALGDLVGPTIVPEFPSITIGHISLMRSFLMPGGSRYVRLGHSVLGDAPPLLDDDWDDDDTEDDE